MAGSFNFFCSFSGGETSAYMSKRTKDTYDPSRILFLFANTGQESERTLEFIDECDKRWGLNVVWVEAIVHHGKRRGCTHRVTNFKDACRDGSLFEEMIKKYGIPNMAFPHCTRELKLNPMLSYVRSIGWKKGEYLTLIGIRSDEVDRVNPRYEELGIWYPLVDEEITKPMIKEWWAKQPFELGIPARWGNCTWCWKKTLSKHLKLIKEAPLIFRVPKYLEDNYGHAGAGEGKRVFFRKKMNTDDLFQLAERPINEIEAEYEMNTPNGCSESCEIFTENE